MKQSPPARNGEQGAISGALGNEMTKSPSHTSGDVIVRNGRHCAAGNIPDDPKIVGAYLWYDGDLATDDPTRFVPITDPFYTIGRPEREAVPGGTCECINAGGIPIVSDRVFEFLQDLD